MKQLVVFCGRNNRSSSALSYVKLDSNQSLLSMEQLQLEVESLVYKQEQERLETVIEDLEISDDLTGKSRVQIIKLVISTIDKKLEGESDPKQIRWNC